MLPLALSGPVFSGVVVAGALALLTWLLRSESGSEEEQDPPADQRTVTTQRSE